MKAFSCLLYAALRDQSAATKEECGRQFQEEVKTRLIYTEYSKDPLPRVTLRRKDNTIFRRILEGSVSSTEDAEFPQSSASIKKLKSSAERHIIENYHLLNRLIAESAAAISPPMSKQAFIDRMFSFITDCVYVYLTIPESQTVARKLILGGRKGKDTEAIDELKALVVFNGIRDEATQDMYLDKWVSIIDGEGRRKLASDAGALIAQAKLQIRLKKNQEYELWEELLRESAREGFGGVEFFDDVFVPCVTHLEALRSDDGVNVGAAESLRFLFIRDAVKARPAVKEIEIAVLHTLLHRESYEETYFSQVSAVLERLTLFFLTTEVNQGDRCKRVFDLVQGISAKMPLHSLDLSEQDTRRVQAALDETDWGATSQKSKCIQAILMRLNNSELLQQSDTPLSGKAKSTLEHILPQQPSGSSRWNRTWTESERYLWLHRFGNLCLIHKRGNSSASNHDFEEKVAFYQRVPFPFTRQVGARQSWTLDDVQGQHKQLLRAVDQCFGLKEEISKSR